MAKNDKEIQAVLEPPVKLMQVEEERSTPNQESQDEPKRGRTPIQDINRKPPQRNRTISESMRGRRPSVQEWEISRQRSTNGKGSLARRGRSRERAEGKGEVLAANSTITQSTIANIANGNDQNSSDDSIQSTASRPEK